jgi:hypothetical protein
MISNNLNSRLPTSWSLHSLVPEFYFQDHRSICPSEVTCEFCDEHIPQQSLSRHIESCPSVIIACIHDKHGCSWKGQRSSADIHSSSCAYQALKGFFSIYDTRMSDLVEENLLLKRQIEALEGSLRALQTTLRHITTSLGPWYQAQVTNHEPRIDVYSPAPLVSSVASEDSSDPYQLLPHPIAQSDQFGFEQDQSASFSGQLRPQSIGFWEPPPFHHIAHSNARPVAQNLIAPLNLSTTLEGSLSGLRESMLTLATSVDSLARRTDISMTNESRRLNEEIMSLRASMQGLRMQVCIAVLDSDRCVTFVAGTLKFLGPCHYGRTQRSSHQSITEQRFTYGTTFTFTAHAELPFSNEVIARYAVIVHQICDSLPS